MAGRNLELAYPQLPAGERGVLQRAILRTTARQALETLRLWTRPHADNLRLIRETEGVELFDAAIAAGRGVIVAAPHYGNWELLNQWLAAHTPLAILYRPPESALGEAFLRIVRADDDGRVEQIRAEAAGIRQLFKRLRAGGVVGILPDQQPKSGDGEFAPFFGRPAYTMTLLPRLAERSGATVLFAYCERIGDLAKNTAKRTHAISEQLPQLISASLWPATTMRACCTSFLSSSPWPRPSIPAAGETGTPEPPDVTGPVRTSAGFSNPGFSPVARPPSGSKLLAGRVNWVSPGAPPPPAPTDPRVAPRSTPLSAPPTAG